MTDISREAVESAWQDYCDASIANGNMGDVDLHDIDQMNEEAHDLYQVALAMRAALDTAEATIAALTHANAALAQDNARLGKRVEDARGLIDRGLWLTQEAPAARAWLAGGDAE